jgi:hypothetical protein
MKALKKKVYPITLITSIILFDISNLFSPIFSSYPSLAVVLWTT